MLIRQILKNLDSLEEALKIQKGREVLNDYNNVACNNNNSADSNRCNGK